MSTRMSCWPFLGEQVRRTEIKQPIMHAEKLFFAGVATWCCAETPFRRLLHLFVGAVTQQHAALRSLRSW